MSWGFSGASQGQSGQPDIPLPISGDDAGEAIVKDPAFKHVATGAEDRLRVSPPWPTDSLPPTTASLLSIASQKGLAAYATPDSLSIVSTEKARIRYLMRRKEGEKTTQPLDADIKIAAPRISHVAFSSDESCLVIAAEQGGGLAVYDANNLSSSSQPAFQIATNGTGVRHLLPNPNPGSDLAHMFGIVLTDGKLLLADLKTRQLVQTQQGSPVFQENVSCAAWSKLGKQIIAGLADATAAQIDAQGTVKDRIPRPPQLDQLQGDYEGATGMPMTSVSWISTYEFLLIYSPTYPQARTEDDMRLEDSLYFYAKRKKNEPFTFHKFDTDPCMPFGMVERSPSQHFIARITEWQNISDMLLVSSTSSTDVGLLGKFKDSNDDRFQTVTVDEQRQGRATLPVAEESQAETSTVGLALDFSTKEVAPAPIPNLEDEYRYSTIPLPAMYLLTTDGILLMWWFVYADAITHNAMYPGMTHKGGKYAKYKKYNKAVIENDPNNPHRNADAESGDETETLSGGPPTATLSTSALGANSSQPTATPTSTSNVTFGSSVTPTLQSSPFVSGGFAQQGSSKPTFSTTSAFGAAGGLGQKASVWGSQTGSSSSTSGFGQASTLGGGTAFGQTSAIGGASAFGKPSSFGAAATFGQSSKPGIFGQPSQPANTSSPSGQSKPNPFAGGSTNDSPFAKFAQSSSPFANKAKQASPFAAAAQNLASPFAQKPSLSQEASTGSTATIGSSDMSSFSHVSAFGGSSFATQPAFSKESTMNEESTKQATSTRQEGGLFGLGAGGFKLGSGFKGDGTAKDDLPKPANAGAGFFGAGFGAGLGQPETKKPEPVVKLEPGTENQPDLKDIPPAKPMKQPSSTIDAAPPAPLPPDPTTYKAPKMPDPSEILGLKSKSPDTAEAAPLPPDPTTYKAPKMEDVSTILGGRPSQKQDEKDVPIAGSPPLDVTESQTYSSDADSENGGPAEDEDDELEELSEDDEDDEGSYEEGDDYEDVSDDIGDEDEEPYEVEDKAGLEKFMARMQPPSPKPSEPKTLTRTPPSEDKTISSSYTPAGLPAGPVFAPPRTQTNLSPRSPSPQRRAVTSPVGKQMSLPSQIKTTTVPPAKPIQKPAAPPKPREPTAGELEDEAFARVDALLKSPVEPTKVLPTFYSHTDYTGSIDNSGIGGQIEKVFRDVNSMIHVVGLNARSLSSFLHGQQELRKPGSRTIQDLEEPEAWCLGDLSSLNGVIDSLEKQLVMGRLENARGTLSNLAEEEKEIHKIKSKTSEMRKQITAKTDPTRVAILEAAPLPAETQAQQTELRKGVQTVQQLLSGVEQKMTMLRADLASLARDTSSTRAAVPTMEAVTSTIQKMTTMVQQKSGDIDVLEAQIKRLPHGIASLRLEDDYEDDLAARLTDNRLLAGSPAATPQRRPRMAANGDALGMSAMFNTSRFQTPPSGRRSVRFTPEASAFGRSAGSLSGSARKKMTDVTEVEIEAYQAKVQRRSEVLGMLKRQVEARGARVVRPE